ncbi:uncharacterized protein MONOS_293 [Monocercomonoides exilis]|uniref:uncharacterized protein n=1 Tax=Monocercomonoides exilis TaxID=2049356 RepID=UPI0035595C88|nr:hypothetical protein MONOS_293 [Monocercomonoides exilis]|eukprot:MONOS_293.1-p1 / transcript=MONOS_293.1 / gene=MONOS_293 / organism=Monocercomonoides_exilis_PA203 / gene_product=unspecified product / transcript_product=unspecified product / location=Mono_scaffold00005:43483-44757(-) / protein_length=340 / sequence_SO=supercontig / SO=protein_coding / is_pseudo=false
MTEELDTTSDEELARALQQELDEEAKEYQHNEFPDGVYSVFSTTASGLPKQGKAKAHQSFQSTVVCGIRGEENKTLEEQHAEALELDELDDAIDEEYNELTEFKDQEINQHLSINDILLNQIKVKPKVNATKQQEDDEYEEEEDEEEGDEESYSQFSEKPSTTKKREKRQEMMHAIAQLRKDREHMIRATFVLNTNVKKQKVKIFDPKISIQQLCKLADSSFNLRGKKHFSKVFDRNGDEVTSMDELFEVGENILYFSCGEDWGLRKVPFHPPHRDEVKEQESEDHDDMEEQEGKEEEKEEGEKKENNDSVENDKASEKDKNHIPQQDAPEETNSTSNP